MLWAFCQVVWTLKSSDDLVDLDFVFGYVRKTSWKPSLLYYKYSVKITVKVIEKCKMTGKKIKSWFI